MLFGRRRSRRFRAEMAGVMEATRALAEVDDLADGLALLARQLTELFDGAACMISRYDAERGTTTDWAGYARPPYTLNRIAESYALDAYPATQGVLAQRRPIGVVAGRGAYPEEELLLKHLGFNGSLMLPLTHGAESFGLVELYDRRRRSFSEAEQHLALLVVDQAAIVLAAHRAAERSEHQDLAMVAALANALEAKDTYTRRHAQEIGELAASVGEHLGLPGSQLRVLRMGGMLHDVGKIGVPEAILNKPGQLTDEEFQVIKQHTVVGANIIGDVPGLEPVIDIVRCSHERWDGAGYPLGLQGDQIPIGARIVAVCDAFHAMTEDRVYRKAMSTELAAHELSRCSGTQFWPPAVAALLAVIRDGARAVRYPQRADEAGTERP